MYGFIFARMLLLALSLQRPVTLDDSVFDQIDRAVEAKDRSALPLALKVLEEIPARSLLYSSDTNERAFDLLKLFATESAAPLLRRIARMEFQEKRGPVQTRELIAIQRALDVLAELRDPEAVDISLGRLNSDSWIQVSALESLIQMQAWNSTPQVAEQVGKIDLDDEHLLVIVHAMRFLRRSREAEQEAGICPLISRISHAYGYCFTEPKQAWRCLDLTESVIDLQSRLGCGLMTPGKDGYFSSPGPGMPSAISAASPIRSASSRPACR
jgi:hypothetical protein